MTLTACASAGKPTPELSGLSVSAERVVVCPAEVDQDIPPRADPSPQAVIRANEAGDAYLDAKDGREDLLEARLRDAKAFCRARDLGRQ